MTFFPVWGLQILSAFRANIDKTISSLDGNTEDFAWNRSATRYADSALDDPLSVNASALFSGSILRSSVPDSVQADRYVPNIDLVVDPTFGGLLPGFATVGKWETVLMSHGMVNGRDFVFSGIEPEPPVEPVDSVEPVVTNVITYLGLEGAANPNPAQFTTNDLPLTLSPLTREGWIFLGWTPNNGAIPAGTLNPVFH